MTNITLPRAELQAALDALQECRQKIAYLLGNIEWYESAQAIDFADISIKAISARLAVDVCAEKQPDVEEAAQIVEKSAQQEENTCWLTKELMADYLDMVAQAIDDNNSEKVRSKAYWMRVEGEV